MQKASPKVVHLCGRILRNLNEGVLSDDPVPALSQALDALRPQLVPLVGGDGYRALISRALSLAKREHPDLSLQHVNSEASLLVLADAVQSEQPEELEAACCAVLTSLFSLLTSFLGVELTRQIVSAAWPHLAVRDTDLIPEVEEV